MTPATALVLYAHGARDSEWAAPFHAIADTVRAGLPQAQVMLAFLEYMAPSLEDSVAALAAQGVVRVRVVPLFWGRGRHLKQDLPAIIDALRLRYPQLSLDLSAAAGDALPVQAAVTAWAIDEASR